MTHISRLSAADSTGCHRNRRNRRESPVRDPLGTALLRQHVRHVRSGGGQQSRPENAVDNHEPEQQSIVGDRTVRDRKERERDARRDQDPALPESIGDRTRQGRGRRRRVRQEPKKQAGCERRPAEIDDVERGRRKELKCREEHRETEPAHHEEARGEQAVGQRARSYTDTRAARSESPALAECSRAFTAGC